MNQITYLILVPLLISCVAKSQYDGTLASYHETSEQLQKVTKERDLCRTKLTDTERKALELEERNQEISNTNQLLLSKNRNYVEKTITSQKEVIKFKQEKLSQEEKLTFIHRYADDFSKALTKEIDQGFAQIAKPAHQVKVTLSDDLFFKPGTVQLHAEGMALIKKIAGVLKKTKDHPVSIEAHTDDIPLTGAQKKLFGTHWDLSSLRAAKIVRVLEAQNIPAQKLSAVGLGSSRPLISGEVHEAREKNKRIEIIISASE